MRRPLRVLAVSAAAALAATASTGPLGASEPGVDDRSAKPVTIAVMGDVPYGTAQEARFGDVVAAVNADPKVRRVFHVGDVKSGSTTCSDERLLAVLAAFERMEDPVVYTPGDNEWTDCHRANNGSYDPLERLAFLRATYFAEPGWTLGRREMRVTAQPQWVENVRWIESRVAFATVHVVGSDNALAPNTGQSGPTPAQRAEVEARTAAALDWVDAAFDEAEAGGLRGVVLAMQADTWDPAPTPGQAAIVARITARAAGFDGEVLLLQGDSHTYVADRPLGLDNVRRIVVHGEALPFEYLRLTVDPRAPELFSWERAPVEG